MTDFPPNLDMGGALAAFGLIFAVYQLRKPQWVIVLRIRERWQSSLFWFLGGAGLVLTLASTLLYAGVISCVQQSAWNDPLMYEVAAYLFFVGSPLSLLLFSTRKGGLFTKKRSRKFYTTLARELSRTNDDGVDAALEVLLNNFDDVCKVASQNKKDEEYYQSAKAVLDVVLSDESVVKKLTTKRLDALQYIFSIIKKYNLNQSDSAIGMPKIINSLFCDKDSFFFKHLGNSGLALASNIYDSIFDSPIILTNFRVFSYPALDFTSRKEIGIKGVEVFIEALSRSIKTYFTNDNVPARHINDGISHLSEMFGDLCSKVSTEERRGVDSKYFLKDEWWMIYLIAHFLGHDYLFIAYDDKVTLEKKEVVQKEKNTTEASFYSDSTISAGMAAALYRAFEQLSHIDNTEDIYQTVIDLLHGMMYETNRKEGFRKPFEIRLWQQIAANIKNRHYPEVLSTYLEFIGFCLATEKDKDENWIGHQTGKMRKLLYIDLKPLLDNNIEMVNKKKMKDVLLPRSIDYINGKFIYTFKSGLGEQKEIKEPPQGSGSALTGIDLEHVSLV